MLNSVPALPAARQPRAIVRVNGEVMPGWIEWEVENNTHYLADTFRVGFAVSALPANRGPDWFAAQSVLVIEILAGFPADADRYTAADLESLIVGRADEFSYDPVRRVLELGGRDLTALMVDTATFEKFQQKTSSEVAAIIAQRHGLTAVVTATKTKVGGYYRLENARLTSKMSEWDMLTWLAGEEGFIVYVAGNALYFQPQPVDVVNPYALQWQQPTGERGGAVFNGMELRFARNLTLARDVIVTVRSANPLTGRTLTQTVHATHTQSTVLAGAPQPTGAAQTYVFNVPGKTQAELLKIAQSKLAEITKHEMRLEASMPADSLLTTTSVLQVTGTGTVFDQNYYPESITRRMSPGEGYRMDVRAKNHSPESQVSA